MREGRSSAARFRPRRLLVKLGVATASLAAGVSGCATEVSTLEPPDRVVAGAGGTVPGGAGGKSSSGGSASMVMAGSAGDKVVNPFGGTGSAGGTPSSGGNAGAGGKAQGGASGSGGAAGAKNGGAAGQGGSGGSGGSGGTAGAGQAGTANGGAAGAGGAANLACLKSWKNDACDVCSKETQSDHLACVDILDCYAANSCGPATCGSNDGKCGANTIAKGTAGYPIAQKVYDCLCK